MRLTLIRHGETHGNVQRLLDTAPPGTELTDLGRAQAEQVADQFADAGIGTIYVSPAIRAIATGEPLAARLGLTPIVEPGIREIWAGDDEMSPSYEAWVAYVKVVRAWWTGDFSPSTRGGEDGVTFLARWDDVVNRAAAAAAESGVERVAFFTHGGAMRTWSFLRARNCDPRLAEIPMPNIGTIELVGEPDNWIITAWNDQPVSPEPVDRSGLVEPGFAATREVAGG